MPSFATTTFAAVKPQPKQKSLGLRVAAFNAMSEQVALLVDTDPTDEDRPCLLVTLDANDKALTISNQIKRAATLLGIEVFVRRSGDTIKTYKTGTLAPEVVAAAQPKRRSRAPKAVTA